ncbi:MAG: hypothetical protein ACOZB0_01625, partial [Pseudomonadota bacterium]
MADDTCPANQANTARVSPRLRVALLWSLLCHALLLTLTFGSDRLGLPGFILPWQDRRIEVPVVTVLLGQAPVAEVATPSAPSSLLPRTPQTATPALAEPSPAPLPAPAPEPVAPPAAQAAEVEIVPAPESPVPPPKPSSAAPPPRPSATPSRPILAVAAAESPEFTVPPP